MNFTVVNNQISETWHIAFVSDVQRRCAIEALEARAPPGSMATLVNSLQNRVNSITLYNFERRHWENSPCDTMHSD